MPGDDVVLRVDDLKIPELSRSRMRDKVSTEDAPCQAEGYAQEQLLLQDGPPESSAGGVLPRKRCNDRKEARHAGGLRKKGRDTQQYSGDGNPGECPLRHDDSYGAQPSQDAEPVMGCIQTIPVDEDEKE